MGNIQVRYQLKLLLALLMALVLGGCVSRDISDLEQWTQEVLQRPGGRIQPLPEVKPYEAYAYMSANENTRDPFEPFYQKRQIEELATGEKNVGLTKEMEREIKERNREELEQFELDSLRMVGTLENADENWVIISDPANTVHRIKVGNYMGRNIGKVINIFEDRVELREIVQDSQGRWDERQAAIVLVEE
ncbi:MAG: type IV pilus assembly protein PilP [Gammaproteobacteria bacterium]|jgi:type IV pilus assembly protein PilP